MKATYASFHYGLNIYPCGEYALREVPPFDIDQDPVQYALSVERWTKKFCNHTLTVNEITTQDDGTIVVTGNGFTIIYDPNESTKLEGVDNDAGPDDDADPVDDEHPLCDQCGSSEIAHYWTSTCQENADIQYHVHCEACYQAIFPKTT